MAVCKFFLSGNCKFGDRCRFEHPAGGAMKNASQRGNSGNPPRNNFQGNQNHNQNHFARQPSQGNRFDSLDSRIEAPGGPRGNARFGGGGGGGGNYQTHPQQGPNDPRNQRGRGFQGNQGNQGGNRRGGPYAQTTYAYPRVVFVRPSAINHYRSLNLTVQDIEVELKERPEWPMSCFGPGRNPPVNLWGGEIEQSPEEVRTAHYLAVANGTPEQTPILETDMINAANNFVQNALRDPRGALDYVVDGQHQHPNRFDELKHERSKHPLFCVDNYHRRRGVFSHIPRDSQQGGQRDQQNNFTNRQATGGFGQPSQLQNGGFNQPQPSGFNQQQDNPFSGQPSGPGFSQPQFGAPQAGASQSSGGFAPPQFGAPAVSNGFPQSSAQDTQMGGPISPVGGGFMQPSMGFGQSINPTPNSTFGQQPQVSHFSQAQQNGAFGVKEQAQSSFGVPGFGANPQPTSFGLQQPQPQQTGIAPTPTNQQSQPSTLTQPQVNGNAGGIQRHPVPGREHLWVDDDLHRLYAAALENGGFPAGMVPTDPPPAYFVQ